MPRCGCAGVCSCVFEEGEGITITGVGTPVNPVIISATGIDGHVIEDEGVPLAQRTGLNFIGDSVVATDDAGGNETDVTINHLATAAHTVAQPITIRKNTGADVGTRPRLNFIEGANITLTVADDAGSSEVDVTIAAAGDAIDSITIRKNTGADVGTRPRLNLIEGTNITLTVVDDAGSNEVDITIDSSGGGGAADETLFWTLAAGI